MSKNLSSLIHAPQAFVDKIGMCRIVSGSLAVLALLCVVAGFLGLVAYSGVSQLIALALALTTALLLNVVMGYVCKIPANHESAIITALILFFLVIPGETLIENSGLVFAVAIAILSKFTIVYRKQHLLNPAAVGAVALGLLAAYAPTLSGVYGATWWVGNPTLFIPLLILGTLIVMKVRKWVPVLWFIGVGLLVYLFEAWRYGEVLTTSASTYFLSWPTLFLAFFMLTEPFTLPPTKKTQAAYGALVGFLSNTAVFIPFFAMTPELALLLGNIAVAPLRVRQKLYLYLEEKRTLAKDTYEFIFKKPSGFSFVAGQYLEWMLPHKGSDDHGVRRYFTIASSPTEATVRVATKIVPEGSSYKRALSALDVGQPVIASQLAGDFVLPKDVSKKLGFIAGGIGITPFRSHIRYMIDSDKGHDTVLYYCNNTVADSAYQELFAEATNIFPFTVVQVIAKEAVSAPVEQGYITAEMLKRRTPDYMERFWYVSGPPGMVNSYSALLRQIGVARKQIIKDFFPGAT